MGSITGVPSAVCVSLCSCCPDGKEYDVYVSYARNAEEEEFVLLTLRGVLENEFGYKLCIFDRDSLPGGSEYLTGAVLRAPPLFIVL